jgi:hypothetical protein
VHRAFREQCQQCRPHVATVAAPTTPTASAASAAGVEVEREVPGEGGHPGAAVVPERSISHRHSYRSIVDGLTIYR